jgi:hypothetical protein
MRYLMDSIPSLEAILDVQKLASYGRHTTRKRRWFTVTMTLIIGIMLVLVSR